MKALQLAAGLAAAILALNAAPAGAADATPKPPMEPKAREAIDKMSAYLRTLQSFELRTDTSVDVVTDGGQRVAIDGTASYKVRRPNGFVISVNTDWKKRSFFYDGKTFTVYAPELGFYATSPAPPTIIETLDTVWQKFGIALPIEDLFRWNDPMGQRRNGEAISSAMDIGPATIDGAATEHYVFRQGDVDWQVWIQDGDQPLPRKLVIIDRSELAQPAYTAKLTWTLNPTFSADDFAFKPGDGAKAIRMTALRPGR